jgi:hypothetical protein
MEDYFGFLPYDEAFSVVEIPHVEFVLLGKDLLREVLGIAAEGSNKLSIVVAF